MNCHRIRKYIHRESKTSTRLMTPIIVSFVNACSSINAQSIVSFVNALLLNQCSKQGTFHDCAGAGVGFMPIGASAVAGILAVVTALTMLETQSTSSRTFCTMRPCIHSLLNNHSKHNLGGVEVCPGVTGFAAHLCVVHMLQTFHMLSSTAGWNSARKAVGHSDRFGKGVITTFAGFLALSALNLLLILILGNNHDTNRQALQEDKQYILIPSPCLH